MFNLNKILFVFFFVLVIIIVGELFYFYALNTNTSLITQTDLTNKQCVPLTNKNNSALNRTLLYNFMNFKKGILTSSIIKNRFEGIVTKIDTKGGQTPYSKYKYDFLLELKSKTNETDSLIFTNNQLKKIKVVELKDNKEKISSIANIKEGNFIIIESQEDLFEDFYNSTLEGSKITIISPP